MRANFHCGPIHACACVFAALDRSAMISAIVRHATSLPIHGEPVVTHHEARESRFRIETNADRQRTTIRLA